MDYYGSKDLASAFRTVRNNTITIAEDIPQDKYGFRPAPESRSVAQTLIHIAVLSRLPEQIHFVERRTSLDGFDFFAFIGKVSAEEQATRSKSEIIAMLREEGERFARLLESCNEEFLGEMVSYPQGMMPPVKSRFEMLMSAKEHEMHHRGQLMIMERMIGIVPHLTRNMQAMIASATRSKS